MKIVFLTRRFDPDIGGVERHVLEISKILNKKNHKVIVVTQSQGGRRAEGIDVVRLPKVPRGKSEKIFIWKWFFMNRELLKLADIIHAHDVYFWYFPFKFLFPFKKSFITFHGYESYPIKLSAIIIRKISEFMADGNIIVGDFIRKWYKTSSDYVIYGGTDIPKNYIKPKNDNSAVFIGRLDDQTDVLRYVNAVSYIRKTNPKFKLVLVGDGKYKSQLRKFKPIGFVKDPTKYILENNFSFVSRYLSILESLAHKRLVFAYYSNPVKEDYLRLAPFARYVIIVNDPEDLAKKVNYYLKNKKEADVLIEKGYEWVKNQSWEQMVRKYLNLWSSS